VARSPDATVGDGSRRGASDDVCSAATGPTAVPPTALGQMRGRGGDVDGGGSLRRSNRPWGGRSLAAT